MAVTPFTQDTRYLSIDTPLGADKLLLVSFSGVEEMSRLFTYHLELLSEEDSIPPADIVGKGVTFKVHAADGSPRPFHGYVSRFSAGARHGGGLRRYRAEVVPWIWFLSKRSNCRIFQGDNVKQILAKVFEGVEGAEVDEGGVRGNHPAREYCVQYRETDLAFVSRLLEEEGIFYWFRHEEGRHTLVLGDTKVAYEDCEESEVPYHAGSLVGRHVSSWEHRWEFVSGKWAHTDYNYETPADKLVTDTKTVLKLPGIDKYEVYDYPGLYAVKDDGRELVKVRMEEEEAAHDIVDGASDCTTFFVGGKFRLSEHECESEAGRTSVITRIEHGAADASHEGGGTTTYSNRFTCIPADRTFRPARLTPKPRVHGPQTAVVVGPDGEEIYTDPDGLGRIRVHFHWDREPAGDESSCWVRVAQSWAGKQWGAWYLPRVGQEVVVEFLEGDPDRPLVTGSVYNADLLPPFDLPANKTWSGVRTRSSKEAGAANCNEIRFEDKKGSEELLLHAEKDELHEVENDLTITVGNDRQETIEANRTLTVKENKTETVEGEKKVTVKKDHTETVEGQMNLTVDKSRMMTVKKDLTEMVDGGMTVTVKKDHETTVEGRLVIGVAKAIEVTGDADMTENVKKSYVLKAKKIQLEAKDEMVMKVGKAKITLKKNGDIKVEGNKIEIKGSSDVIIKGSKSAIN